MNMASADGRGAHAETVHDLAESWSPLRDRRFWGLQLIGWGVAHYVCFGDRVVISVALGMPADQVVIVTLLSFTTTVLCSAALAWLFVRVPSRRDFTKDAANLVRLTALAIGASLPCSLTVRVALAHFGWPARYGPEGPPILLTVEFAALMLSWSAIFFVFVLNHRLQRTRERMLISESLAQQAQLHALRARIHPHFLFNALNSVIGLVPHDQDRAQQMLRDVSELLRRSLAATHREGTTLQEELEFVESYLRCEETRFGKRLRSRVDVPVELRSLPVPSMLLQPVVENAVKHGMAGSRRLQVEIVGCVDGGSLILEVRNTGRLRPINGRVDPALGEAPMADEARPAKNAPRQPTASGTGLSLVRDRLTAGYPETGHFALLEEAGWVVARMTYDPNERAVVDDGSHAALRLVG